MQYTSVRILQPCIKWLHSGKLSSRNANNRVRNPNGVTANFLSMQLLLFEIAASFKTCLHVTINSFDWYAFILETTLFTAMKWKKRMVES